ncbi:uncharacterized protein LOC131050508 isoform X2 [Cryptomeria japonica]|uniref:uncharacterized protein LOC131050508 isoform X2 n=1 Tax=Cryptomeria japonica TaxID=3369 RepID=UPI0027DA0EFD|nr:uncharacterized protein LOC131050508 isoform X2 [Cryptomeria japonica]
MLEQFFSESEVNAKLVERKSRTNESTDKKNQRILLSGPSHSGKTSLLLQFAYNCARETSATVVFLCKRNNFEKNPPFLPQDVDPSSEIFERVHIKYIEDDEGIRKYFAAFHMHSNFPRAVILDDFCEFFDEGKCREKYGQARGCDVAMVRTLALCCDAINHANDKLPSTESCKLLISDSHIGDTPRLLYIYQRWLPCILTVNGMLPSKDIKIRSIPYSIATYQTNQK